MVCLAETTSRVTLKLAKTNSFLLNSIRTPRKQNLPSLARQLQVLERAKANKVVALVKSRVERKKSKGSVAIVVFQDIAKGDCFKNPAFSSYRKPQYKPDGLSKKRKFGSKLSFDEYSKKKKEYEAYVNDLDAGEVEEYDEH